MNLSESLELYKSYQLSGMQENQIKAIFEGLDTRDKDIITNKDLRIALDEVKAEIRKDFNELKTEFKLLNKDFMYMKLMMGSIIALVVYPVLKGLLS